MSNVVLVVLFLFMVLAPCVVHLMGWFRGDPEADAEAEMALGEAQVPVVRVVKAVDVPVAAPVAAAPMAAEAPVRVSLETEAEWAEAEAAMAVAAAGRAAITAREATSRAVALRAEAAAEASRRAEENARVAAYEARVAIAEYDRILDREERLREDLAPARRDSRRAA